MVTERWVLGDRKVGVGDRKVGNRKLGPGDRKLGVGCSRSSTEKS